MASTRAADLLDRRVAGVGSALVAVQMALLFYNPQHYIPSRGDRTAAEAFVSLLRTVPGEVLVLDHGYFPTLAGKRSHAHESAIRDVLLIGDTWGARLETEFRHALETKRFDLVIQDTADWFPVPIGRYYRRTGFVAHRPDELWPPTGNRRSSGHLAVRAPSPRPSPEPGPELTASPELRPWLRFSPCPEWDPRVPFRPFAPNLVRSSTWISADQTGCVVSQHVGSVSTSGASAASSNPTVSYARTARRWISGGVLASPAGVPPQRHTAPPSKKEAAARSAATLAYEQRPRVEHRSHGSTADCVVAHGQVALRVRLFAARVDASSVRRRRHRERVRGR